MGDWEVSDHRIGGGYEDVEKIAGVPVGFLVIINKDGLAETQKVTYDKPEDLMPFLKQILVTG